MAEGGGKGRRRAPAGRRASSYDVAALAGVSQSAVSRAFRANAYLSDAMRARVLEAARTLGFRPNAIARSLATRRSGIVAVAIGGIGNPIYPAILDAFGRRLAQEGLEMLLLTGLDDAEEVMARLTGYQTDAVLVTASTRLDSSVQLTRRCQAAGVPVVLFNRVLPDVHVPAVACANREGGRMAAELLLRAGHRHTAFIGGPEETSTVRDRRGGFADTIIAGGAAPPRLEAGPLSYEGGRAALLRLMAGAGPPDAVFCTNDMLAIGAMDAARQVLGLRVPEDLSVIGFDDVPMAAWDSYALTTVRQRTGQMVEAAVALLAAALSGAAPPPVVEVPVDLVARRSVRGS
jgi:DNA-binding LacI/PurR family transcriptional regulator